MCLTQCQELTVLRRERDVAVQQSEQYRKAQEKLKANKAVDDDLYATVCEQAASKDKEAGRLKELLRKAKAALKNQEQSSGGLRAQLDEANAAKISVLGLYKEVPW